jgi:cellulose synthase/poly-beta-1,6-N-acetylglucosamine synthase-like glycosyltransferase
MVEIARQIYASLVVGGLMAYICWNMFKKEQHFELVGIGASVLLLLVFLRTILLWVWLLLFVFMAVCVIILILFSLLSLYLLIVSRNVQQILPAENAPKIAVLIAAKDEALVIAGCLDAVLSSHYPANRLEIFVIDDCSSDGTADIVAAYQDQYPNIHVFVRSTSALRGKAAALNEIISKIDSEFTCILDADHRIAKTFFCQGLTHFQDSRIGAVQVRLIGHNRLDNLLTRLVDLELLGWQYSFLNSKSHANLVPVYFGSGCIFRTELLQRVAGFNNDLMTEDVEFSFRLYGAGYKIKYEPNTYVTYELISDSRSLFQQRYRWARGLTQAVRYHWLSFYRTGKATRREKLGFLFYPVLLCMMIIPCLQIFTHAVAITMQVDLPFVHLVPLVYMLAIFLIYLAAGLQNQKEQGAFGIKAAVNLLLLNIGMCFYYCLLVLPAATKAFLDEFVLEMAYPRLKTKHLGPQRSRLQQQWLSGSKSSSLGPEEQMLLAFGGQTPNARRLSSLGPALYEVNWKRTERFAKFHGVAGLMHANLVEQGLDSLILPEVRKSLLVFRKRVLAHNLYLQYAWHEVAQALDQAQIETIPLKGIHFINHFYSLDVRPLYDIDLMVKPERVAETSRLLRSLGYQEKPFPYPFGKTWCTQQPFRNPLTEVVIDLHWDLINVYPYGQIYVLPITDIWQRARPSGTHPYQYDMAPEDLLLHNALHCAVHHSFTSLSHLVDLGEVVRTYNSVLDWTRLIELAAKYHVKVPVYFALILSRELIDTQVPETVLTALQPPLYRRLWFRGYLFCQRKILDKLPSTRGKELKCGFCSIILADRFVDSLRVIWAILNFFLDKRTLIFLTRKVWDSS